MKIRRSTSAAVAATALLASCAGAPPEPLSAPTAFVPPADVADAIRVHALRTGGTWRLLEELCTTAPTRLSGSPGAERAVAWSVEAMRAAGLENVRLEPCTVPYWERGDVGEVVVVEPVEARGERLAMLALGGSVATPSDGLEADVVLVQSFAELSERADEVRGKLVLHGRPMDPTVSPFEAYGGAVAQRSRGAVEAARAGAVGSLCRSLSLATDDVPHTGGMRYDDGVPRIPSAALSTLATDRIAGWLAEGRRVRLAWRQNPRWREPVPSFNVVGELVGREQPEEIIVLGGHLDSWDVGQGAHDDAAGCVQTLEAVRLLKELELRPRRTLRVVFFMNEENGLAGGRAYREQHADEMGQHVLAIESDRGAYTPRGFTTNANAAALSALRAAVAPLAAFGADRVLPGGGGADISPMGPDGVVLVGYLPDPQRYFDLHHTAADTLDRVHPRELELGTVAIATLAWAVAEAPSALPRNP